MPDESCRKCGGVLLDYSTCSICKGTIQFICRICGRKTIARVHKNICFRMVTFDGKIIKFPEAQDAVKLQDLIIKK